MLSGSLGRWVSPDWSASPVPVPYADLTNPQSLNLYGFVGGNPASKADPDGHCPPCGGLVGATAGGGTVAVSGAGSATATGTVTGALWGVGSVALPGMIAGGVAYYGINTVAGNKDIGSNATFESIHATNQLAIAISQKNSNSNKVPPPPPPVNAGTGAHSTPAPVPGGGQNEPNNQGKNAKGRQEGQANQAAENTLPTNESQLGHIFRDAEGHLPNTPENQQLLQDVANDPTSTLGTDKYGTTWSARTLPDGTQVWTQTRNGVITNGGLNQTPQVFNPQTGLSVPVKPGG